VNREDVKVRWREGRWETGGKVGDKGGEGKVEGGGWRISGGRWRG